MQIKARLQFTQLLGGLSLVLFLASCETGEAGINVLDCATPLSICSNISKADTIENYANWIKDDCDGGGIDNKTECENGTDFNDPTDDCKAAVRDKYPICEVLRLSNGDYDENHVLAFLDCDGGGIDNITECRMGLNPIKDNDTDELNFNSNDAEIASYLKENGYLNIPDSISLTDTIGVVGNFIDTITVNRTESGLIYIIKTPGSDIYPNVEDTISYHLKGYFLDGNTFQDSAAEGPIDSRIPNLIPGLQEAMQYFSEGAVGTIIVPSYLAYGSNTPNEILADPYIVLLFDIELLDVR